MLLTALLGSREAFEAEVSGYVLTVWLSPHVRRLREAVCELLRYVVPANMGMLVISVYNTHRQLGVMTHGAMRAHTHEQLKQEVDLV